MEWWLIVSGAFNIGLAFWCLWNYLDAKMHEDMKETYKEAMQGSINEQAKMHRLLKQYSDKVYEANEDVWLAVFRSGVETDE